MMDLPLLCLITRGYLLLDQRFNLISLISWMDLAAGQSHGSHAILVPSEPTISKAHNVWCNMCNKPADLYPDVPAFISHMLHGAGIFTSMTGWLFISKCWDPYSSTIDHLGMGYGGFLISWFYWWEWLLMGYGSWIGFWWDSIEKIGLDSILSIKIDGISFFPNFHNNKQPPHTWNAGHGPGAPALKRDDPPQRGDPEAVAAEQPRLPNGVRCVMWEVLVTFNHLVIGY